MPDPAQNPVEATDPLPDLKKKRTVCRAQLTKIFKKAEAEIGQYDAEVDKTKAYATLRATYKLVQDRYARLIATDEQIFNATQDPDLSSDIEETDDYEIQISERKELIGQFLESRDPSTLKKAANASFIAGKQISAQSSAQRRAVQLPKLELQTFAGDTLKWVSFNDTFNAAIHNDGTLDNIQKFTYLRSLLTGEAARTIEGLDLTDANYASALTLLRERYGQKQVIISAHMKSLWELPTPTEDATSLRHFYDSLESHVRGLHALGEDENSYGKLLVPMILEKLPTEIQRLLARARGDVVWNLPDLRKAILTEIKISQVGNNNILTNQPTITATFHTTTRGQKSARPKRLCAYCKGSHSPSECTVVTDAKRRLEIVRRDKLCYNCLAKHLVGNCASKHTCRHCQRKHHSSLHIHGYNRSNPGNNSSATNESNPSGDTRHNSGLPADSATGYNTPVYSANNGNPTSRPTNGSNTNGNNTCVHFTSTLNFAPKGPVLLKTAKIPVSVNNGTIVSATVLFDEGANRTFVTESFADKIHANTTRSENIDLASFGNKHTRIRSMKRGTFDLHTISGNKAKIDALLIPEISTSMSNHVDSELLTLPYLKGLRLAHPVSNDTCYDIDILIGADYYWNFVGNEVIRGKGPTAVSSPFGYSGLLSGPKLNGKSTAAANVLHVMTDTCKTDIAITSYWDLESIGIKDDTRSDNTPTKETEFKSYSDTHLRREDNHFVAKLAWKSDHAPLPTNYNVSNSRTRSMIRRLPPNVVDIYDRIITDQEKQGFIEVVKNDNIACGHYLPHRSVKKDSETTPIRIVYDCSCKKNADSPSLNDCLMTGPPLLNDLTSILLRFRANPIALTSDIEKAFLQIRLEPDERKFTKFLWLSNPRDIESEFVTYSALCVRLSF
ncbi:uncharacterized protein LOC100377489 [Saccoglossus kowalevskii]|uniref:Uncharacterized protein LOC100377489 n=1 Tax=Saccoglossus kowalevskii TaxID=10224 RepID=A0ABM0MP98_SACKO|nr:PREDICTED: uncharacterized protein LOC100377489 [Saccoglossus kowalevskii]